jgi:hypothetical protein
MEARPFVGPIAVSELRADHLDKLFAERHHSEQYVKPPYAIDTDVARAMSRYLTS